MIETDGGKVCWGKVRQSSFQTLSFFPRCQGEYGMDGGTCADCPGVRLLPVTSAPLQKGSRHAP